VYGRPDRFHRPERPDQWPIYAVVLRNLPWAPFIWFGIEQAAR
jgi:hypothetical protein